MKRQPLRVAFLWHMHQPYYRNPRTGAYSLPWVRLHTSKDYYDMLSRLERFPSIKANFNIVPCLIEQILEYAGGNVKELHLELSRKPAAELEYDEKVSVLRHFFLGNRPTMIEPYPRYRSLLEKCRHLDSDYQVDAAVKRFRTQDFLDLQVWSNLAWIGPESARDPVIKEALAKGREFTEEMKQQVIGKQLEIMGSVLDKHRELADAGQIEVSTSPYFHPIVPLLCDSSVASVALPGLELPTTRVRMREDALGQIVSGRALHEKVFGRPPSGMWPPEGGVSDETVELASQCGIRWMATDESILAETIGQSLRHPLTGEVRCPGLLYKPHRMRSGGGEVVIFFRDRKLSDLISFGYTDMPARDAVSDFMDRLHRIAEEPEADTGGCLVLVALDGENCWEFYDRGGDEFLNQLYGELSNDPGIETVLLSDVLQESERMPELKSLHPGSWISRNFGTWIGHGEDNKAWDILSAARAALKEGEKNLSDGDRENAWKSIHVAQGSDWFWWYGGERLSREDTEFDALFRAHMRYVYELLGAHVPHEVLNPIMAKRRGVAVSFEPVAVIKPILDGRVTSFYEWKLAGLYESYRDSSRTIFGSSIIDAVYFGFDHETLYLRFDTSVSPGAPEFPDLTFSIEFEDPKHQLVSFRASEPCSPACETLEVEPEELSSRITAKALEIIEIAIPFDLISAKAGDTVSFRVALLADAQVIEHRPVHEVLSFTIPAEDFEAEMWVTF